MHIFLLPPKISQNYSKDICISSKTQTHEERENGKTKVIENKIAGRQINRNRRNNAEWWEKSRTVLSNMVATATCV